MDPRSPSPWNDFCGSDGVLTQAASDADEAFVCALESPRVKNRYKRRVHATEELSAWRHQLSSGPDAVHALNRRG